MPGKTAIAWSNWSHNYGAIGCDEVTEECSNCYARDWHNKWARVYADHLQAELGTKATSRIGAAGIVEDARRRLPLQYNAPFSPARRMKDVLPKADWVKRLLWPTTIGNSGLVFCNSMTDLFHSVIPDEDIFELIEVYRACPWLQFQILTKRTGRLRRLGSQINWPKNVWVGESLGMNKYCGGRFDALMTGGCLAAVRFFSLEPLLEDLPDLKLDGVDWVIVGAESGTGMQGVGRHQRSIVPMDLEWVRHIRNTCQQTGTRLFFKQAVDEKGHKTQLPPLDGKVWDEMPRLMDTWNPTVPSAKERHEIREDLIRMLRLTA